MNRLLFSAILVVTQAAATPAGAGVQNPLLAFEEPLVKTARTSTKEDAALFEAIRVYRDQAAVDDFRVFDAFLADYPHSGWRVALLANLGLSYYHYGYFSRAIDSWEQAWQSGRLVDERRASALVDRAVGELVRMHARLGHAERLAELFKETSGRHVTGPATEALAGGKEGLWMMQNNPGVAYLCGPMALKMLLLSQGAEPAQVQFLDEYRSGPRGVTLAEVAKLASDARLKYRLVFRDRSQAAAPVPSIVHWKVSHFAAIVGESGDRLHVVDPTFGEDLWITRAALDAESSGYFLAPGGELAAGWREVGRGEAETVRGMGFVQAFETQATRFWDWLTKPCGQSHGMCGYNITEMLVSLTLRDTPVGYQPPRGPAVFTTLTYNQREAGQPANFSFFNASPKWSLNWLAYIQDDPRLAGANVTRYAAGGGSVIYSGYNTKTGAFTPETHDASVLIRTSATPITYERRLPDGGREVYAQPDGATTFPRRFFLSQIFDPAGNMVSLTYDGKLRLLTIRDALGRATTFSYDLASQPLLVTRIIDPFGRSAKLDYDAKGRLTQITDVAGLTSQFTYDNSSLINAMTTAYGTTKFTYGETGTYRWLEATDALGNTERVEFQQQVKGIPYADPNNLVPKGIVYPFNQYLNGRDSFYWDKHAYKVANGDHAQARNRHWTHTPTSVNVVSHTVESYKMPFENRVWHNYPGQQNGGIGTALGGTLDYPSMTGRVLDDGTTQLSQITYNSLGKPTSIIDPVGRQTLVTYDSNQIDLLKVQQKTAAGNSTVVSFTYNSQHKPLTFTDAAGQTSTYLYDLAGNLIQATDPLGHVTKYEYDSGGHLARVVNPNGKTAASFTYDSAGRIATRTDSEGLTVSFAYDSLDRMTQQTYPDGTTRQYTWNKLDLVAVKDRQGRTTQSEYDAVRNLTAVIDPLGRRTQFTYYENGMLKSLIDPNGNVTTWSIDTQNRVTGKQYADGRQWTYTYENTTSRLKSSTDPQGQVKQYSYTLDDQVASLVYANPVNPTPSVKFAYDPYFRRLVSMTDGGGTRTYEYQPLGAPGALRLAKASGPYPNDGIGYQYDALGRLIGRTVDTTGPETFAYDSLSRLTSHVDPLGTFDLGYLGETGLLTSRQLHGGTVGTTWSYDSNTNDRRLTAIANSGATRSYQFTTTPENLVMQIAESAPAGSAWTPQTWSYTYDSADRLLQASSSSSSQYTYDYDPADNITSAQSPNAANGASYDAVNQVANFNGQNFVYDANGNLIEDGARTFQWDAENRLIAIGYKNDPARNTAFRYDGFGRRIATVSTSQTGTVETHFLWCGSHICQQRDASDVVSRRYYSEGELTAGGGLYYAEDQLGTVRDVTAVADGSPAASYDYDPYGNPSQTVEQASADFRYAGMFYERGSGLYLTMHRAYDPATGRWLSRDPLGQQGGINLYSYAIPNPISYSDPSGLLSARELAGDVVTGQAENWLSNKLVQGGMPKDEADFIAAGLFGTGEAIWTTRGGILLECPECLIPIFLLQGYKSRVEDTGKDLLGEILSKAFQNFQSGQRCYIAPAIIISPWYFNPTVQNDTVPDDGTASLPDSFAPDDRISDPGRSFGYSPFFYSPSRSGSGRIQAVYVGR